MTDSFVPDRPVICPYDDNHSIAQSRFQRHIIKCSKNFSPNHRLPCPYNASHRLRKSEMGDHVLSCLSRQYVDRNAYEAISNCATNFEMEDRSIIHCDESWDDKEGTLYELSSMKDSFNPMNMTSEASFELPPVRPQFVKPEPRELVIGLTRRSPLGRPGVLMMEDADDSPLEDMESVSFTCAGRGKPQAYGNNSTLLDRIRKGRGIAAQKN